MIDESSSTPDPEAAKAAYRAKLRSLSFGKVPGGSRETGSSFKHRPAPNASWEKGIAGEHRADGSFMPYVDGNLAPIGVKQFGENRHRYEAEIAKLRQPTED